MNIQAKLKNVSIIKTGLQEVNYNICQGNLMFKRYQKNHISRNESSE